MLKDVQINYWRLIASILFGAYFFYCTTHPTFGHFIDNVDLIIHEAGHWIFIFFGQFIQIVGGSFLQIFIPVIFSAYFLLKREYFAASLLAMWVGYNIVNVSIYMGDAIAQQIPLLGGDSVIHDWNYLLSQTHLLNYTSFLSGVTYFAGFVVIVAGVIMSLRYSILEK